MITRRVARGLAVAVFSTAVAFTPLSATLSHSQHETWFPPWDSHDPAPHVRIYDRTGLVSAIYAVVDAPEGNAVIDRLLVLTWLGGCSDQLIQLTFEAAETGGYLISKRELSHNGCPFLVGIGRTVVLHLRWPVNALSVRFDAVEASVR